MSSYMHSSFMYACAHSFSGAEFCCSAPTGRSAGSPHDCLQQCSSLSACAFLVRVVTASWHVVDAGCWRASDPIHPARRAAAVRSHLGGHFSGCPGASPRLGAHAQGLRRCGGDDVPGCLGVFSTVAPCLRSESYCRLHQQVPGVLYSSNAGPASWWRLAGGARDLAPSPSFAFRDLAPLPVSHSPTPHSGPEMQRLDSDWTAIGLRLERPPPLPCPFPVLPPLRARALFPSNRILPAPQNRLPTLGMFLAKQQLLRTFIDSI